MLRAGGSSVKERGTSALVAGDFVRPCTRTESCSIPLCLLRIGLCFLSFDNLNVISEDCGNHRDHVCLDHSCSDIF